MHDGVEIGPRIRALRQAAGLTQADLAKRIGIRLPPMGRIERGESMPSGRVLLSLVRVLGVSADRVLGSDRQSERSRLLDGDAFRVDGDGSALSADVEATGNRLVRAILELEDLCHVPKSAALPLTLPFEPTRGGMEDLAWRVRQIMAIQEAVVFDYLELFEVLGFRVVVLTLPESMHSMAYYDPGNLNAFFFLNARNTPERQLFRLAYELGHTYLATARLSRRALKEELDGNATARLAKAFAAFFLMPEPAVRATVEQVGIDPKRWNLELVTRLKHRFGVSAEAFLYRLGELDLVAAPVLKRLKREIHDFYASAGSAEPGDSRRVMSPNGRLWDLVAVAGLTGKDERILARVIEVLRKERVLSP